METTIKLSADQVTAVETIVSWYQGIPVTDIAHFCDEGTRETEEAGGCPRGAHTHGRAHEYPVMSLGGLAGTGKTTVMGEITKRLKAQVAYCAPTHKAAAVLRRKLPDVEKTAEDGTTYTARPNVSTYHALIYYPHTYYYCDRSKLDVVEDDEAGGAAAKAWVPCGEHHGLDCKVRERLVFEKRAYLGGWKHVIIVDESSMVSTEQINDLRSFGVPVLLVGDHGQLPPVKADMNPWIKTPTACLEINHRQGEGASITQLAHSVRNGHTVGLMDASSEIGVLFRALHGDHVTALFDRFECGPRRVVITWKNKTRVAMNQLMRSKTGDPDGLPRVGDRVISLAGAHLFPFIRDKEGELKISRNLSHRIYVHNGQTGTVTAVGERDKQGLTIGLSIALDDVRDCQGDDAVVFTHAAVHQFNEYSALPLNSQLRPPKTYSLPWTMWDYGYAITAHKAQGSEYDDVIVIDENPMDYERWVYTAVTRAARRLVVVKW